MSEEQMKAALQRYVDGWNAADAEAIVGLFADDAVVEDPYGTPPHDGKAAIRKFVEQGLAGGVRFTLDSPIRASYGDQAAMAFTVEVGDLTIKGIDVMRFNEEGLIVHMQAMWGNTDLTHAPAASS